MGRKSKRRQGMKVDGSDVCSIPEDMMMLDIDRTNKDVKLKSKEVKKQKKLMKKLAKRKKQMLQFEQKQGDTRSTKWHKVMVQSESVLEKDFLLSSFSNSVEVEFQPLGYHKLDGKACFYLENNGSAAGAIGALNKRVQGSDGSCLNIAVVKCTVPELVLNSDQLQVLREVMANRFNTVTCLLDLTDLHHDPALLAKDILVPLASPPVMKQVLRQIRENIPHLKALNLSKNNLKVDSLKLLQSLENKLMHLSALNLEDNNIRGLGDLKFIKMFPLTELSLQFNPVVETYKQVPLKYVRAVKNHFKSLKMLDKVDVDVYLAENVNPKNDSLHASKSTPSCSSTAVSEAMVRTFLEQFYALVDTQQRPNLLAAYTPDAVMEVKSSVSTIASAVFNGQSKISEALHNLPATLHNHSTFGLKIEHLSPSKGQALVTGQCQVVGVQDVVTFTRSMNIVPFNTGLCCSYDILELR